MKLMRPAMRAPLKAGQDRPGSVDRSKDVIVGHWLANSYMSVHAPGQPCGVCDGTTTATAPPSRRQHRRLRTGKGRIGRSISAVRTASAAIAIPLAALSLAAGVGSASAASANATAGVTWHKLTLINGWKSSQTAYGTGNPSYAISGGVVYLSGSLNGGTKTTFAVLPAAARPARKLYFTIYTVDGNSGTLVIRPNGSMSVFSTPASYAALYTSLAAVSYLTTAISQHKLRLLNGWKSSQPQRDTGDPAYAVRGGIVYLSGSMHGGANSFFSVLPVAARPARWLDFGMYTQGGAFGYVVINATNGDMFASGSSATQLFTSLAGFSFPAATTTRHKLALLNGWTASSPAGDPAYSVIGGVVHLSGAMFQPSDTGDQFAVLPPAARPAHNLYIAIDVAGADPGTLRILHDGRMFADSFLEPAAAQTLTSLATISYPRNS